MPVSSNADAPNLIALIKASPLLDPALRRSWLHLVPALSPRDRARLSAILRETVEEGSRQEKTERESV